MKHLFLELIQTVVKLNRIATRSFYSSQYLDKLPWDKRLEKTVAISENCTLIYSEYPEDSEDLQSRPFSMTMRWMVSRK